MNATNCSYEVNENVVNTDGFPAHMPRLFHVSERPGIARFEPRLPPTANAAVRTPVVWVVDEAHLPNYLVPRECPRVAFR